MGLLRSIRSDNTAHWITEMTLECHAPHAWVKTSKGWVDRNNEVKVSLVNQTLYHKLKQQYGLG